MRAWLSLLAAAAVSAASAAPSRPAARPARRPAARQAQKPAAPAAAKPVETPYRRTPYVGAMAIDAESGLVLFEDRADAKAYPASVTKLMTAYLVLDDVKAGRYGLGDAVAASPVATSLDRHLRQPSCTGLRAGDRMTVDELLKSLMVNSANDAAIFLAEKSAGKWQAFVERMNAKARALGMTGTSYVNPNGLPPIDGGKDRRFNVSNCRDLAKLTVALLRDHPEIIAYTRLKTWRPTSLGKPITDAKGVPIVWKNHNNVMVKDKLKVYNPDGSEPADGLKTGYIDAGGSSVILTGTRNGRRVAVIVLGSSSAAERDAAARRLLAESLDAVSL